MRLRQEFKASDDDFDMIETLYGRLSFSRNNAYFDAIGHELPDVETGESWPLTGG